MGALIAKLRILPVTIFVSVLFLSIKVGDIWQGVEGWRTGVSTAGAQQSTGPQPKPLSPPNVAPPDPPPPPAPAPAPVPRSMPVDTARFDDPSLLTQAEIDLLQQLAERREVLDKREREMALRDNLLNAAESRIDRKVSEMQELQQTIQGLIKSHANQQDQQLARLVKIYENMKPKDAARIFEELDMVTLLLVVEGMKERKLAPILASMNPQKAKEMTVELARLREIPVPEG